MRYAFSVIFSILIVALSVCTVKAARSGKALGPSVALLLASLIPPMAGNLIIILFSDLRLVTVGRYIYFLGMDMVMFAVTRFTRAYCFPTAPKQKLQTLADLLLLVDAVQLLLNPIFGHAFGQQEMVVGGRVYYALIPYAGQTFHRAVDYGILFVVILLFIIKSIRCPRIEAERYLVILAAMIFTTIWESVYIFSSSPIDRSMIGFGVFGLLVYYLALNYRPMRLLDSMLANIASELPESLFFFDTADRCIWANKPGRRLVGVVEDNYDPVRTVLEKQLGPLEEIAPDMIIRKDVSSWEGARSYLLEKHSVTDNRDRPIGWFMSIRDNTAEHDTLLREQYKATHDALTGLYNRAGYERIMSIVDPRSDFLLFFDIDNFKTVNDTYGHETGDRVLQKTAAAIQHNFRAVDYICRIGGDEFVVILTWADVRNEEQIALRIRRINEELQNTDDGLPPASVSVGIAHGAVVPDPDRLMEYADEALYETKRNGRCGYTFYRPKPGENAEQTAGTVKNTGDSENQKFTNEKTDY